ASLLRRATPRRRRLWAAPSHFANHWSGTLAGARRVTHTRYRVAAIARPATIAAAAQEGSGAAQRLAAALHAHLAASARRRTGGRRRRSALSSVTHLVTRAGRAHAAAAIGIAAAPTLAVGLTTTETARAELAARAGLIITEAPAAVGVTT